MKRKDIKKSAEYWRLTAAHDYETMRGLFKIKRYSDCLFYGHIVLEKILKALVVGRTREQPPRIHDLIRLEELTEIGLNKDDLKLLNTVNGFNIRARYPGRRLSFYKICTREYALIYLEKIENLYERLCQELKLKK
jgi:HEPN domain-containing protein